MVKKEEAKMRAEIEALQRELSALLPPGTFIEPSPELETSLRDKIAQMQTIEKERTQNTLTLLALAGAGLLMAS